MRSMSLAIGQGPDLLRDFMSGKAKTMKTDVWDAIKREHHRCAAGMSEDPTHFENFPVKSGWTKELSGLETLAGILIAKERQEMPADQITKLAQMAAKMADAGDKRISKHLIKHVLEHEPQKT